MQFIRYVFNSIVKASSDRALLRTASGKPFQTRGAAGRRKTCSFWPLAASGDHAALRVPERRLPAHQQSVMRYFGARSFRHLCTSVAMLYCVHCRTNMHYRSPRRRSSGQSLMITTFSEQMEPLQYVMECVFCMSRTAIYATLITYLEMSFRV